ncbi:MAG: TonB-dependent receptor [Sphingobacteriaceae bacterium]|nr:TonB-dependent receptor [Sphingobacteriaceae bacterium]
MKLTTLLLIGTFLQVSAVTFAQKISYSKKNASLKEVFTAINKQTGYNIVWAEQIVQPVNKIDIDFHNANLTDVLDFSLKNLGLSYVVFDKMIVIRAMEIPIEEKKLLKLDLKGTILDEDGKPLVGASIKVKGSQNGAVSDANGSFLLKNIDEGTVLVVSFLGYITQEVKVSSNTIVVRLVPQTNDLNDVVISVGYGTQEKAKVTGSISTLSGDEIRKRPVTNNTSSLAGLVPGLVSLNSSGRPGSGSSVSIRGVSSYNNASALYVIDGVVRDAGSFSQLDPNEIESISILKDAGSAAIYGVRSTNGVILVTTKRGSIGKPTFSYNTNISFDKPTRYANVLNAYDQAVLRNEANVNMGNTLSFTPKQIEDFRTGTSPSTDWRAVAFKDHALTQQHNITVNGGAEAIKYFFSLGYTDQNGIYDNLSYNRYNFRSNIDAKINENLTLRFNLEGRIVNNTAPNVSDEAMSRLSMQNYPTTKAYYDDGLPVYNAATDTHIGEVTKGSGYNKSNDNLFVGQLSFIQKLSFLTKGLNVSGGINIYNQQTFSKQFNKQYPTYEEDDSGKILRSINLGTKTTVSEGYNTGKSYTLNFGLDYSRTFGQHTVKAMTNFEQYQAKIDFFNGGRTNFQFSSIDQIFAGANDDERTITGSGSEDGRMGIITRLNYDYAAKYLLQVSFRNDASYRFSPEKRWGFFPAASAGWVLSQESFIKDNLKFVDFLKIRASYGLAGNDNVGGFQWRSSYGLSGDYYFSGLPVKYLIESAVPNPNLTWEKTKDANFGLDATFLKGLIGFNFDYFRKNTYDIYGTRLNQYPGVYGATLPAVNYGKIGVHGFEFAFKHQYKVNDLRYSVSGNISFNRNKVKEIDYTPNIAPWNTPIGKPTSYTTGYTALGLYQTNQDAALSPRIEGTNPKAGDIKYADLNNDGIIDQRDVSVIQWYGSTPEIMYGLTLDAEWKGFDFNVFFQATGNRTVQLTGFARNMFQNGNSYAYFLDRWTPGNPNATIPRSWIGTNPVNDQNSTFWLRDASFIRVKNIQLGYTLPASIVKSIKLSKARFFVSGSNLFVFSKIKDFDPEFGGSGFYYPQNKSLVVGANISF